MSTGNRRWVLEHASRKQILQSTLFLFNPFKIVRDVGKDIRAMSDQQNEGWALLRLGESYLQQGYYAEGQACCEQALVIFNEINEPFGKSRTLAVLFNTALEHEQPEKAFSYNERALRRSREDGDRTREGYLLERTGFFWLGQGNYSVAQNCLKQALNIARETGNREDEVWALLDSGRLHLCLGDYDRAQAFTKDGLHIAQVKFPGGVFRGLAVLGLLSHCRGDDEVAQQYGEQALHDAQEAKSTVRQSLAWRVLGDAAAGLRHWNRATQAYTKSLELQQSEEIYYFGRRSRQDLATESRAGLARVALAQGDTVAALTHTEAIARYLKEHPILHYAYEPLRVYFTCYQILHANADPRAQDILKTAYTMIQERAVNIEEENLRRSYLENVPYHRELVAEWERVQAGVS